MRGCEVRGRDCDLYGGCYIYSHKWRLGCGQPSFSDNAPGSPHTVALSGTGEDFTFAAPSGSSATVTPGQAATYTLSLGGQGGLSGGVTFTCTGAPSEATCTLSRQPGAGGEFGNQCHRHRYDDRRFNQLAKLSTFSSRLTPVAELKRLVDASHGFGSNGVGNRAPKPFRRGPMAVHIGTARLRYLVGDGADRMWRWRGRWGQRPDAQPRDTCRNLHDYGNRGHGFGIFRLEP